MVVALTGSLRVEQDYTADRAEVLRMRGPGLRAVHASRFGFRSPEKKRESLLLAAFSNPGRAQNGILRAHIFPFEPATKERWNAVIAVGFPLVLEGTGEASQDFGAVKSNNRASWSCARPWWRRGQSSSV